MENIAQKNEKRPLGKSGLTVSPLAWGMWRFGGTGNEGAALLHAALDAGIDFFDTADIYGFDGENGFGDAEQLLGDIFAAEPGLRDRMILASKGGIMPPLPYDSGAIYLQKALDASLRRLRTDRLDLWFVHRPDILTHPQELARTLENFVSSGKVRAIGVSNFTLAQIDALQSFLTIPIAASQPEFSPFCLDVIENGQLDQAMRMDMAVMAWSPLGGGRISSPTAGREADIVAALDQIAAEYGVSRAAAAYGWIMAHPARPVPIIGSQTAERIAEAADAFKIKWTRQSWYDVLVASRGEKLP